LKITIQTSETIDETEIAITCHSITPEIEKMISTLKVLDKQLVATKGNETFFLSLSELLYMETVDKKTFVYTAKHVYETEMKLYELEEQFGFFRAGKSCIIHLKYVRSLKAEFDRRIRVTMENGEQIMVSRQYAEELKKRLGVK
jgi:DNA-binding LytR/AlgR family response regulator